MDIIQILITIGASVGILVVAVLAVVPTVLEIPSPDEVNRRPRPRHLRVVRDDAARPADRDWHLAA